MDQISLEWTFLANNKTEMPNRYFGNDLDSEFIPKLIPRGPTWDEMGIFLIYGSNQTKFLLSGPFWLIIRLRWLILILWMIWTPNSSPKAFNWDELGTNLIYRLNCARIFFGQPFWERIRLGWSNFILRIN